MAHHISVRELRLLTPVFMFLLAACSDGADAPDVSAAGPETTIADERSAEAGEVDLVIRGGRLLDMAGESAEPTAIKGLVIKDGRIDRILAADSSEPLPSAERTIEAGSLYIMPGLIDSHVHFHPWTLDARIWRGGNLHYGVTTIMDTGPSGAADHCTGDLDACIKAEPNEWIVAFKDYLNDSGQTDGPTMYVTGEKLDVMDSEYQFSSHRFESLEQVAGYIYYLAGLGVDAIKAEKGLPPDYRRRIIEEANRHGLEVVGHSKDARESIAAGMKFIEHMWPIAHSLAGGAGPDDFDSPDHDYLMDLSKAPDLIELMVGAGVYLNPTLLGRYGDLSDRATAFTKEDKDLLEFGGIYSIGIAKPERLHQGILRSYQLPRDIEPEELVNLREGFEKVQAFLKQFSEAGGMIIAATDNTMFRLPGISMHREMQLLADAGVIPYKILLGSTRWPAEMIRKDHLIGTLEAGKQADILLLGSDPAEDIANSRDIRFVIRKGKVLRSPEDCSVILPPVSPSCN